MAAAAALNPTTSVGRGRSRPRTVATGGSTFNAVSGGCVIGGYAGMVDDECANFAALIRPAIDRVYVSVRAASRGRLQQAYERLGLRPGFESSFYFGLLARPMPADSFAAATTYSGSDMTDELEQGTAFVNPDSAWQLTVTGRTAALAAQQAVAEGAEELWSRSYIETMPGLAVVPRLADLVGRLLTAGLATGGPAFLAMAPVHEPENATPALRLSTRLGALRHHRGDAHRAAWAGAGLTVPQLRALADPAVRASIEAETNRRDGHVYRALPAVERVELLAGLAALAG
jgi:hypothetical protein